MGKKSPPEPKDYTKERAAFAQSELANRQTQADTYNAAINSYNTGLQGLTSRLSDLGDSMQGMTIRDDELWGGYRSKLSGLERELNQLNSGLGQFSNTPSWNSTVNSPYGAVEVGLPQLSSRNTTLVNSFSSQLGELRSLIAGLEDQRKAEQSRIDTYAGQLSSQLSGLGSTISGFDIDDIGGIQSTRDQLATALAGINGFSSSILDEYRPTALADFRSQIGGYQTQLDQLMAQRAAEEARIRDYELGLNSTFDTLNSQFGGLTIADIDTMNSLQRQIDQRQLDAARFTSPLSTSFGDELSAYTDLESRLQSLFAERAAEEARVKSAQQQARDGMSAILSQLGSADIYNAGLLNQLQVAIDQGQSDIGSFSSLLPFNFSDVNTQLDTAEAQLQALRQQRAAELGGFGTQADQLAAQISGYDLANESGIRGGLTSAQGLMSRLGQFTGTDVANYRTQLQSVIDSAQGRLGELTTRRGQIESQARALLNNARTRGYYDVDDIDALAEELAAISNEQSTFSASGALDEIDAITALIGGERTRLSEEAKAAEERLRQEQESYYAGLGPAGGPGYAFAPAYQSWLASWQNRRMPALPSSFARQLQVQYV